LQVLAISALSGHKDFFWSVNLQTDEVGCATLRKEELALVLADIKHRVVTPRVVDEWNVDRAWQAFIDATESLDQRQLFVIFLGENRDTEIGQCLDKIGCRFEGTKRVLILIRVRVVTRVRSTATRAPECATPCRLLGLLNVIRRRQVAEVIG